MLRGEKRKKFDEDSKNERITAKVTKVTRGGLVLQHNGIELFMPTSHIDTKHINPDDFAGKTLECFVIENTDRKVVVSRKAVLQQDARLAKKEAFEKIEVGQQLDGTVTKIMNFGAFVNVGDIEGLLHISEMSHHRVENAGDLYKEGDAVHVQVIQKQKMPLEYIHLADLRKG